MMFAISWPTSYFTAEYVVRRWASSISSVGGLMLLVKVHLILTIFGALGASFLYIPRAHPYCFVVHGVVDLVWL